MATAATQPYPVGDKFVKDCADPIPGFPLTGCMFDAFFDLPVVMPEQRRQLQPELIRPADRLYVRDGRRDDHRPAP